jgi:DnaJ domain
LYNTPIQEESFSFLLLLISWKDIPLIHSFTIIMSSFGTVLLLEIFPALLPPKNSDDRDFYAVLDLPNGASEADVRKAYKKKSLALHPDKIAQRGGLASGTAGGGLTAEEAAKEYQLVQEAHGCLSTTEGRKKYHAVQCSPTRYRFLTQEGGLANQASVIKNLSQASFGDKTRLVLFVSLFPALLLVQPILLAVKVNQILKESGALENASWMAILIPWWFFHALYIAFWIFVAFLAPPQDKFSVLSTIFEQILWYIAFMLLALRWDYTITSEYALVFIPVYLALLMGWLSTVLLMQHISTEMSKMVSKDHFLSVILHGREPEELEEEELKGLHDKYVVVQQIPEDVEHELLHDEEMKNLSNEEKEEIRVSSSREFEAALEAIHEARWNMIKSILLDVAFLVLLILKVDNHYPDLSWWIVFSPILVHYGLRYLRSCFICCCSAGPDLDHDDIVVLSMHKDNLEKAAAAADAAGEGDATVENDPQQNDTTHTGSLPLSSTVLLHSLKTQEFNGKTGIVKGPLKDGRQEIYIPDLDKLVALKLENLKLANDDEDTEVQTTPTTTDAAPVPDPATSQVTSKDATAAAKKASTAATQAAIPVPAPSEITDATPTATAPSLATEPTAGDPATNTGDEDEDEAETTFRVDPETYRAYQSAYAAAEANAMEKRVKAGQDNCITTFQIVMLCLLVAKLQQAYEAIDEREENGDDADVNVGFNALWLIFPLFLVVGFMISCCACLIYNARDPEELMGHNKEGETDDHGDEEANNNTSNPQFETPMILTPPPPPPPPEMDVPSPTTHAEKTQVDEVATEEASQKDKTPDTQALPELEEAADINDLD